MENSFTVRVSVHWACAPDAHSHESRIIAGLSLFTGRSCSVTARGYMY